MKNYIFAMGKWNKPSYGNDKMVLIQTIIILFLKFLKEQIQNLRKKKKKVIEEYKEAWIRNKTK